ncbi:L-type lectin-domain containing receptor kinase IX.2-like [Chenopodium quinoa]|uniref:L-type lectin-domain containing receptor kinase IX.2-like n=1 Tax=Chenopodium quinoa TaxID=63459 RepID=UPI000B76EA49|nr:L-type lectin-domain containing receptor kinase IX.2-like [Chenopodium quinoa]
MKFVFQFFVFLLFFLNHVESLFFNFTGFDQDSSRNITCKNDTHFEDGVIQMTKSTVGSNLQASVGRASYNQPVRLWDKKTSKKTDFTTHFSFQIKPADNTSHFGDGMTFFTAPFDDSTEYAPETSYGRCLGLVVAVNVTSKYRFVAVEFDTFKNWYDLPGDHLGIDDTSVVSQVDVTVDGGLKNRSTANSWITYDSVTKNLSVYLTYEAHPVFNGESSLSHIIDLSSILPETVRVGFTSSTGTYVELHSILSWDFNSTLEDTDINVPWQNHTTVTSSHSSSKAAMIGGLVAGISVLIIGSGSAMFMWGRRRSRGSNGNMNFDQDTGPRRFTYNELIRATSNFLEERKLGQGGFGGVYKGFLSDISQIIAVKKISKGSKQGEREYVSEVKVISRLRHKNLVQLLGWCHEKKELLLVYEFMPNGSLDSHIFAGKRTTVLPWADRYKIAYGLASALLYLHEEWEQCVLHRDIKSSNVMLDSNFNAKLGDFGLARLVDHNRGSQTTVLA